MRRLLPIIPFALVLGLWQLLSCLNQGRIIPAPANALLTLAKLLATPQAWLDIAATLSRGAGGLLIGSLAGIATGIFCGRHPTIMDSLAPLVTLIQSCPPIVWLSLLLVWLSIGGTVPLLVTVISVAPALFLSTANAVRALDSKWFEVAAVFGISRSKRLRRIILPGISSGLATGLSYAFGIAWKVTATAEFFGANNGIGARIFQAYRNLNLSELAAWTLIIALIGIALETTIVRRLRK